jgi:hypothetical protein
LFNNLNNLSIQRRFVNSFLPALEDVRQGRVVEKIKRVLAKWWNSDSSRLFTGSFANRAIPPAGKLLKTKGFVKIATDGQGSVSINQISINQQKTLKPQGKLIKIP